MPSPLVLQPDASAGKDTRIIHNTANAANDTLNYGALASMTVGTSFDGATYYPTRSLMQFDLSSIPATATCDSAVLGLYQYQKASTLDVNLVAYRILRAWDEGTGTGQAGNCCWDNAKTGVAWGTAGCANTTSDRESAELATTAFSSAEASGWKSWTLDAGLTQDWWDSGLTNNGLILVASNEPTSGGNQSLYRFYSSDEATNTTLRPKLTVTYTEGGTTTVPVWLLQHRSIGIGLGGPHA
jgi:hypothetical protein